MAKDKDKHPSWFKMKLERRELVKQLSPETAVNVLLACWDFLETGEKPANLSPIESVAFSAFMPDMEEAWVRYVQRITNDRTDPAIQRPGGSTQSRRWADASNPVRAERREQMRKGREMDPLEAKVVREQFERAGNLYQKLTDRQKKKVSALIRQLLERQEKEGAQHDA